MVVAVPGQKKGLVLGAQEGEDQFRPGAEKKEFQAEVSRLMDIIVHSLYSNKDIFLRELVSNAADALDKVRFLSLTDSSALGEGDAASLPFEIKISVDKENKRLVIRDTGIGMTKEDLVSNLGTIARSGTAAFLEQMQKGGDLNLIGQFGVGFYSVYLVADYVEVTTKHASDEQWVWESAASGHYAISRDEGEPLGRGTQISIHVKEEASEYLEESKIRELIETYSEFIDFPISLLTEKTVEKEVPVEDETDEKVPEKKEGGDDDDDEKVVDVEEEEEETKPKTKKVTETVKEWEVLNDSKALWLRTPGNVTDEEYEGFYKALSKNPYDKPLAHTHFKAEGDVDFKAVLYLPTNVPPSFYDNFQSSKAKLKLYVRRVFISDSFEELLPKWLSFLVGLVDSDSMPLNVSREMLQLNEGLKVIRKKLIRKAIEMMKRLSDEDLSSRAETVDDEESQPGWLTRVTAKLTSKEEKEIALKEAKEKAMSNYKTFWNNFGKAVKMGIIEDTSNRKRLLPLMRFETSSSNGNMTSFDEYTSRMKENQTSIYYLVGTNGVDELKKSPFVETLVSKGYEVIFFTDPLDEYVMSNVNEYEEKTFINISKDDLKLTETEGEEAKERAKRAKAYFKGLTTWWKKNTGDSSIGSVKVSDRLSSAPCAVVSGKYGWTATMEKIARAQALGDNERNAMMKGSRVLEINPRHPLIKELRRRWDADPEDTSLVANAHLLYETCLMDSGFILDDVKSHSDRILSLLGSDMGVSDLSPEEEDEYPEVEVSKSEGAGPGGDDGDGSFSEEKIEELLKAAEAESAGKMAEKDEL